MKIDIQSSDILLEDKDIIVIKKSAGIASESKSPMQKDMVRLLKNYLALTQNSNEPYIGLVHRLDQPVSGIMVFAKTPKSASVLSKNIQSGLLNKNYTAVVHPAMGGNYDLPGAENEVRETKLSNFLLRDKGNTTIVVSAGTPGAKRAELIYTISPDETFINEVSARTVKIKLITGRHHQIRVQLSNAGLPIIGDRKYGCMPTGYTGSLLLCANDLEFTHPVTGEALHFTLPEEEMFL
ncbi:MAG: RluA family pseudouridine synthase [Lachnospiraceae bacterium]|nr:RluA family pseudouridine synthase [Lachnospiraceae bacterium]